MNPQKTLRTYWISWYHPESYGQVDLRLNAWVTGMRLSDDAETVCAYVEAEDENRAKEIVSMAIEHGPEPDQIEWRFVEAHDHGWRPPGDRFPQ